MLTPQKLVMICAGTVFLLQIDQVQEVLEKGIEAEMVMHRYSVVRETHLFSSVGWNIRFCNKCRGSEYMISVPVCQ